MATISTKNMNKLCDDFIKNYKSFESYMKFCIKLLQNLNWIKKNQFNIEVNDYDFIMKMVHSLSDGIFSISFLKEYRSYYNSAYANIKEVKTNILYIDILPKVLNAFENIGSLIEGNNSSLIEKKKNDSRTKSFDRMYCKVVVIDYKLEDREYNVDELYHLVEDQKICILDNFVANELICIDDLSNNIKSGKWILQNTFIQPFMQDSKLFFDYVASKNEVDRKIWFLFNGRFCKYLREKIISFNDDVNKININYQFNIVYNHIYMIVNTITKRFKKGKIPPKYKNLLFEIMYQAESEMENFENGLENIPSKILKSN